MATNIAAVAAMMLDIDGCRYVLVAVLFVWCSDLCRCSAGVVGIRGCRCFVRCSLRIAPPPPPIVINNNNNKKIIRRKK